MKRRKEPTWTRLVEEALRRTDDFMDMGMLQKATGGSYNQISAALFNLRKFRVADVVVNADGHGWWYALPPEGDTRVFHVEERVPEVKPRKPRRKQGETHFKAV